MKVVRETSVWRQRHGETPAMVRGIVWLVMDYEKCVQEISGWGTIYDARAEFWKVRCEVWRFSLNGKRTLRRMKRQWIRERIDFRPSVLRLKCTKFSFCWLFVTFQCLPSIKLEIVGTNASLFFRHRCVLTVQGASGGLWNFPLEFSASEPEPDEVIYIEAAGLNKLSTASFSLFSYAE